MLYRSDLYILFLKYVEDFLFIFLYILEQYVIFLYRISIIFYFLLKYHLFLLVEIDLFLFVVIYKFKKSFLADSNCIDYKMEQIVAIFNFHDWSIVMTYFFFIFAIPIENYPCPVLNYFLFDTIVINSKSLSLIILYIYILSFLFCMLLIDSTCFIFFNLIYIILLRKNSI